MNQREPKIYFPGAAKELVFQNGGSILKLGVNVEKAIAFLKEHANERGYCNLVVSKNQQPDKYNNTHCVTLDTWKPDSQRSSPSPAGKTPPRGSQGPANHNPSDGPMPGDEDVPF